MLQTAVTLQENERGSTQMPVGYFRHLQRHTHLLSQKQGVPQF
jgi:hypothetical protein